MTTQLAVIAAAVAWFAYRYHTANQRIHALINDVLGPDHDRRV